jgi:glucosamine-6-phosphate deaminase
MHQEEGLDFSQVTTFNLDEYVGLDPQHEQSYHRFMHDNFFSSVNIPHQNIYIPSGTTSNYQAFCEWYEQRIRDCGGSIFRSWGSVRTGTSPSTNRAVR